MTPHNSTKIILAPKLFFVDFMLEYEVQFDMANFVLLSPLTFESAASYSLSARASGMKELNHLMG